MAQPGGGLCVEALHAGAATVTAFEPRNLYHKSIAKVSEFCEAALGKTFGHSTVRPMLQIGAYDLIIWSEGLDEIRDPAEFFRSVVGGLRPGGTLLIEVSHGTNAPLPKSTNAWRPSIDSFESTIKSLNDLEIVAKRPGRNQLRIIYTIRNISQPATSVQPVSAAIQAPVPSQTVAPAEAVIAPVTTQGEVPTTPKQRRGRKPKPPTMPPAN